MVVALEEDGNAVLHHQLMHGKFPAGPLLVELPFSRPVAPPHSTDPPARRRRAPYRVRGARRRTVPDLALFQGPPEPLILGFSHGGGPAHRVRARRLSLAFAFPLALAFPAALSSKPESIWTGECQYGSSTTKRASPQVTHSSRGAARQIPPAPSFRYRTHLEQEAGNIGCAPCRTGPPGSFPYRSADVARLVRDCRSPGTGQSSCLPVPGSGAD